MLNIEASEVRELRETTGISLSQAKWYIQHREIRKLLEDTEFDEDKAETLRKILLYMLDKGAISFA